MNWKKIGKVYSVMLIILVSVLVLLPVTVQSLNEDEANISDDIYTINVVSDEKSWKRMDTYSMNYNIDKIIEDVNYKASVRFTYNLRDSNYRDVIVKVNGYANGEEVGYGEHALLGVKGTGGNVFHFDIPQQVMKPGVNEVDIVVMIDANASSQLKEPDEVALTFDEMCVKQVISDSDSDGITNPYDLLKNTNNVVFIGLILTVLFPPILTIGLKKEK